jgi:hypothetical protein
MPLRYGLDGCLGAVVEVEFGEDAGDVVVDGVGAERQLAGDLVIVLAAGELAEDLKFAFGERGADRVGGVLAVGVIGISRSRIRYRSFPAICGESTDSPAAVALTASMIAFGGAVLRM